MQPSDDHVDQPLHAKLHYSGEKKWMNIQTTAEKVCNKEEG